MDTTNLTSSRRKRRGNNKRIRESVTFKLPVDLVRRLGHYAVDYRPIEKSEVVEEALDKFLTDKGY